MSDLPDLDRLERLARNAPHMSHVRVLNTDLLALINRIRKLENAVARLGGRAAYFRSCALSGEKPTLEGELEAERMGIAERGHSRMGS